MSKIMVTRTLRTVMVLCIFGLLASGVMAQEDAGRELIPDQPVAGVVDEDNPAQVYVFAAEAGDVIALVLSAADSEVLALLVTDAGGESVALARAESADETILEVDIAAAGTYYVTVFPAPGAPAVQSGEFTLSIQREDAEEPATDAPVEEADEVLEPGAFEPGEVVLEAGAQVDLVWNTRDDLNLQIRDPIGETLFWGVRSTTYGGTFGPDVNGLCENLVEPPAVETASWTGATMPTGSYEILVYHRQVCEGEAFPVDFSVNVAVDGEALEPITGTIDPPVDGEATVYISSFVINADGTAEVGAAGPYLDTRILDVPAEELLALEATPVTLDEPQQGVITSRQPYQAYSFAGQAGEVVGISMTATGGSLDTLLLVLDSSGSVIAANDDIEPAVITDSAIDSLRLPVTDTYTIIATRYGKLVGGTEGPYELLVSGSNVPAALSDLDLPAGDIEVVLTWNTDADIQLLVRDPAGSSVYDDVLQVPSGGRMTAQGNLNCLTFDGPPVSYIYWPDGFLQTGPYEIEVWYQSECGDTRPMTFELYVVVEGELVIGDVVSSLTFNERYVTNFTIDLTGQPARGQGGIIGTSETFEYRSEIPSAMRIVDGQTVTGSITGNNPFDLYTFEGRAGDVVTISMDATSQNLDTMLYLIDPNGVEIAFNDDSNETTNSLITGVVLTQDGDYIIIATRFGAIYGGTIGGYNLALRVDR
jgi:hypothetical protein